MTVEKLTSSMTEFLAEEIWLSIDSADYDSIVAGAPQVLPLAERLTTAT